MVLGPDGGLGLGVGGILLAATVNDLGQASGLVLDVGHVLAKVGGTLPAVIRQLVEGPPEAICGLVGGGGLGIRPADQAAVLGRP